jgi:hypothetical protein
MNGEVRTSIIPPLPVRSSVSQHVPSILQYVYTDLFTYTKLLLHALHVYLQILPNVSPFPFPRRVQRASRM